MIKMVTISALLTAVAVLIIKEARPDLVVLNRGWVIFQLSWTGTLLATLVGIFIPWLCRVISSKWAGMYWSARRNTAVWVRFHTLGGSSTSPLSNAHDADKRGVSFLVPAALWCNG